MTTSASSSSKATLAASVLVCALGTGALYLGTAGFRAISTEQGRRLAIADHALLLPAAQLALAQPASLQQVLREDGRVAIVTFMYSSCNAVCSVLGSQYQQLQATIVARGLQPTIRLLSISVDPRDTPDVLAAYALRQHAQPGIWRFAGISDAADRTRLLKAFGVVVVPVPPGEFQHNAAFHVVDRAGRLTRIVDLDEPEEALDAALSVSRQQEARR